MTQKKPTHPWRFFTPSPKEKPVLPHQADREFKPGVSKRNRAR